MARAIWTGAITFGLVNIPVKIFPAVQESSLDLDMLDSRDHSNIRFKRVNESTGREVNYNDIVKGYKYHDDYVILEPEDFLVADEKKSKVIEILSFAEESEVESIYYEQPYYLQPEKSGEKAYALLRDALISSGKVGVSSFVLRNRETLALIKPYKNVIVLNRIRFSEEIRDTSSVHVPPVSKAATKEKQMALKLIDQLTEKFNISRYKDTYTANLMKLIRSKAKSGGKAPAAKKLKIVHTRKSDLMSVLEASLSGKKKKVS